MADKKKKEKAKPVYNYTWATTDILQMFEDYGFKDPIEQRNLLQAYLAENGGKPKPEKYNGASRQEYFENKYGLGTQSGVNLGNIEKGDGGKFYGRGIWQLTGRWNYERMQKLTGIPVFDNPDLMNDPTVDRIVSMTYLKDRQERFGIKNFKDPRQLHNVIRPAETFDERNARVIPISDIDWDVLSKAPRRPRTEAEVLREAEVKTGKFKPQYPAEVAPKPVQEKTPYGVRMTYDQFRKEQGLEGTPNPLEPKITLEQFRREQSGGITPDTTPPAR